MQTPIFLFTSPFTQLNTPYPATAYLKGFLNTKGISSTQADLGIEVILSLFSSDGLQKMFAFFNSHSVKEDANSKLIFENKSTYINTIDPTITFLQGKNDSLAEAICSRKLLPEANRFKQLEYLVEAFNSLSLLDKAKHLATLYLEDISDFIKHNIDEHFGFSRYAERLGRSANTFDELYHSLQLEYTFIDVLLIALLNQKLTQVQPLLVCISIPFPGNLYSALRCGQYIKKYFPTIKVAIGGGFANTELRSLTDERVFEFVDFICLDDGELPLEQLYNYIQNEIPISALKRTFTLVNNVTTFVNNNTCTDYKQATVGTPDYSDLLLTEYINAIEVINPMHRLWSDGRWNKLTMAHGCYWGKCTFCDVSLPYIRDYEPVAANLIVDRIEAIIQQTHTTGFHFVDEAAPPSLMRNVAIEILRRKLKVTWWTNVRFEKSFTENLCYLLAASGCIAVSGGLEVASDRLLALIDKGITVKQVAKVTSHFTKAKIMVHSYLMYGYPTQTEQETVDSMEMVRQLFEAGTVQSGFWHRFAMTSHSPVGMNPAYYKVVPKKAVLISFADNDVDFDDTTGTNHDSFSYGLEKSLLNYMHGAHFDKPLQYWFTEKIPKTTIAPSYIKQCIEENSYTPIPLTAKVVYIGKLPTATAFIQSKKGMQREMLAINFNTANEPITINIPKQNGEWLMQLLLKINVSNQQLLTYQAIQDDYTAFGLADFELFWENKPINKLNKVGLLIL